MKLVILQRKPIRSKGAAVHKVSAPTGKIVLMIFINALTFGTKFIEKFHINFKPFFDLPWTYSIKTRHGTGHLTTNNNCSKFHFWHRTVDDIIFWILMF